MKKFYLGALGCLLAMGASAQKVEQVGTMQGEFWSLQSIPTEFAYGEGESPVFMATETDMGVEIIIYNKKFEVERTITINAHENFDRVEIEQRTSTGEWIKEIRGGAEEWSPLDDMNIYLTRMGIDGETRTIATQTLFNDDKKWEFIRPIYKEVVYTQSWNTTEEDRDGDGIIDYKKTTYGNLVTGYEVVSEDGNVLYVITAPEGRYHSPFLLQWDEESFFCINLEEKMEENDTSYYEQHVVIHSIDKNTSSVQKIAETPAMRAIPALAERNTTVNVTLDAETVKNGGELIITDSNGRTVGRSHVEAGQTSVPVTTDRMGSGVYNITLTEKGQKVENARIIVK